MAYKLKTVFLFIMIFLTISSICGQEKQRTAVIPFNPINILKADAEVIYTSFETALVQTDTFFVIDSNEIGRSLVEQGYSLFDCTNEQCAVEFGKLLSAGQVILGSLSYFGGSYTLKIKVIDLSNEKTVYLDKVSASSLDQMSEAMELFAFKLAGLTYTENGEHKIARQFCELFIETTPSRADIYINGVKKKGTSPELISRTPLGRIRIEARQGDLYGERDLQVTENIKQVQIKLAETYGSMVIKSEDSNVDVYLDSRWLGKLGSGSFSNLSVGIHTLELKGQGLYWRDEVLIPGNQSAVIEVPLKEYGALDYAIPEGATAEIKGRMFRKVVKGYGTLPVPAGDYSITVTGKNYEQYEDTGIIVPKGANIFLKPALIYSREYEYDLFTGKLEEAEQILNFGYLLTYTDIERFEDLKKEIELPKYSFTDLIPRAESLIERAKEIVGVEPLIESVEEDENIPDKDKRLEGLFMQKQELEIKIENSFLENKTKTIGGWTSLGLGLVSAGLSGLFYYFSNEAYEKYERFWDTSAYIALGTSGFCLIVSSLLLLTRPSTEHFTAVLETVEKEINILEKELQ
jgi:hypothetical protein